MRERKWQKLKRYCRMLAIAAVLLTCAGCGNEDGNKAAHTGFYMDGTTLYDANGNPFVMRGVNHGPNGIDETT